MSYEHMKAFLRTIEEKWDPWDPSLSLKEIAQVEIKLKKNLPDELKALYERANGAWVNLDVFILSIDELEEFNSDESSLTYLPSAVFFAMDEGSGFFFIDTDGSLKHGTGAVFWCDRSALIPDMCKLCNVDLLSFLSTVIQGEDPRIGLTVRQLSLEAMFRSLERKKSFWHRNPGATDDDIAFANKRCDSQIPGILQELLQYSNGLVFNYHGIILWSTNDIDIIDGAVSENHYPGALLIGEDRDRNQYGITTLSWSSPPQWKPLWEGQVIRFVPNQTLEQAELLGFLPDVVVEWLEDSNEVAKVSNA